VDDTITAWLAFDGPSMFFSSFPSPVSPCSDSILKEEKLKDIELPFFEFTVFLKQFCIPFPKLYDSLLLVTVLTSSYPFFRGFLLSDVNNPLNLVCWRAKFKPPLPWVRCGGPTSLNRARERFPGLGQGVGELVLYKNLPGEQRRKHTSGKPRSPSSVQICSTSHTASPWEKKTK